jgi:hypothetical protein
MRNIGVKACLASVRAYRATNVLNTACRDLGGSGAYM